jgi:hypothetical protein
VPALLVGPAEAAGVFPALSVGPAEVAGALPVLLDGPTEDVGAGAFLEQALIVSTSAKLLITIHFLFIKNLPECLMIDFPMHDVLFEV